jgi:2-oxoglutarate ferredoxin oxidoreductase subunit beta
MPENEAGNGAGATVTLSRKDFQSDQEVRWCPGCGDYSILAAMQLELAELGVRPENLVFVSGIGCAARFPYYMNTYGLHSIHGRAPAVATGVALARPDLDVWVIGGDGDMLSIGGNHLIHALRRNVSLKIIMFNNQIYGLTKGQYSPTSELGKITKSTPMGSADRPVHPCSFALGVGATFVARTVDRNVAHMEETLKKAAAHEGAAFVEILQNCNIYNDLAWNVVYDRESKVLHELRVEHGKPLVFGPPDDRRGLVLEGVTPRVVRVEEVSEKALWVHDVHDAGAALVLASLESPEFPIPVGVLAQVDAPRYEETILAQEQHAIAERGPGEIGKLLVSGDTWKIG